MKIYQKVLIASFLGLVLCFSFAGASTYASVTPNLSLSNVNSTSAQINVYADPNSNIELHYGPSSSSVNVIGSTDQNGNFSTYVSTSGYNIACNNTAYVVVNGMQSSIISWTYNDGSCNTNNTNSGNPYFSQNNLILAIGQTQSITVNGTGGFYISGNSNSGIISTNLNGNILNLTASSYGSANITVCESDAQCNTLYVSVGNNNSNNYIYNSNQPPTLTSFTVSSNDASGQFIGSGNILTLSFTANEQIQNVSLNINGSQYGVSGTGNGPYTTTYTIPGNYNSLPVMVNFTDFAGRSTSMTFAIGSGYIAPVQTPVTVITNPSPVPTTNTGYLFYNFLTIGSSGNDVIQLQNRLTSLGMYSGPITGYFGSLTAAAVARFQASRGISAVGYVGPSTRAALNQY